MVPKADGTLWLCTDFRKVNSVIVSDPFSLTQDRGLAGQDWEIQVPDEVRYDMRVLADTFR